MDLLKKRVEKVYEEDYPDMLEFKFPCGQTGADLTRADNYSCQWCNALAGSIIIVMGFLGFYKIDCFQGNSDCTDWYAIAGMRASFKGFMRKRYIDNKERLV